MDMISLYNTKRRWGREWGRGEKRGIPWTGQLLSPQWGQGSRKWCLVPQMFALSCWLRNLSWVLVRQTESKLLSKGHCFLRGRIRRRGKKIRDPNGIRCHPGKATSHLLSLPPTWQFIHSHPRDSQVLQLNPQWKLFLVNWEGTINLTKKMNSINHCGPSLASELSGSNDLLAQETNNRAEIASGWGGDPPKLLRISHLEDDK